MRIIYNLYNKRKKNMAEIICGVYKITNTITGDFYIGSSKNVKYRWARHKCKSTWNEHPNNPMYLDFQEYGLDKFVFEILEEVEIEKLKEAEQQFIEKLQPTYNQMNAKGLNIERCKKTKKEYHKSDKFKEYQKEYYKSERGKESHRKAQNKYDNQLCCYNDETMTLNALRCRFKKQGIEHPVIEAKKYLIED